MGQTHQQSPFAAVKELASKISQPDIGLIILFVNQAYATTEVGGAFSRQFPDIPVIGTTCTAEIGPEGYLQNSLAALSIHRDDLQFTLDTFPTVSSAQMLQLQQFSFSLKESLRNRIPDTGIQNSFALMFIDASRAREERIVRAFHDGLGGIHLIGGSASGRSTTTQGALLMNGKTLHDAAILLVATTPFPFEIFKEQHFSAATSPLVVTSADPDQRIVKEFNGLPACAAYAYALNLGAQPLTEEFLAKTPLVIKMGDASFVRSIHRANPDGSLSFLCAIEEGAILHPAQHHDMVASLTDTFSQIRSHTGQPTCTLAFDCLLRHTEILTQGYMPEIENQLHEMNAIGPSTLGEQFCGMHVNHTMTGISFGAGVLP